MAGKQHKRIFVIDKHDYWRTLVVHALEAAGYTSVGSEDCQSFRFRFDDPTWSPDLVILGCSAIGPEEMRLIAQILEAGHQLVVCSGQLPWNSMRSMFLLGVTDVADKPDNPARVVEIVDSLLKSLE